MTSIGESCFYGCALLTSVQLPSSLRSIGEYALRNTNISTVVIPEGVTSLAENCFDSCKSLTSVQLPSSVKDNTKEMGLSSSCKLVFK